MQWCIGSVVLCHTSARSPSRANPCIASALSRALCWLLLQFVAFFPVAFVAYFMRTRHGYRSLPEAIHARYGGFAALAFGLAVAYRYAPGSQLAMQLQ